MNAEAVVRRIFRRWQEKFHSLTGETFQQRADDLAEQGRKVLRHLEGEDADRVKNLPAGSVLVLQHLLPSDVVSDIEILRCTTVGRMLGDGHLSAVEIVNNRTGEKRTLQTAALFSFMGATPRTDWLPPEIEKDEKHFVRTGIALADSPD